MSDRVAVFNDGVIQQLDAPSTFTSAPKNSFVAQFIGENNKLPGTVEELDGEKRCAGAAGHGRADRRDAGERARKGPADAGVDPPRAGGVQARDDAKGAHTIGAEVQGM